ncbi:MAG: histidine phosphatase family protein, partial [Verrucomicrobia bacterium]|nr:histidine phosphatase family protein [Verrucomicrobiota bacterium]
GIALDREQWNSNSDAGRPLTAEGERQLQTSAAAMKRMGLQFDVILSSPFERAKRTAQIVAQILRLEKKLQLTRHLQSDGDPKKLVRQITRLKPSPRRLLLVGHEPYLSGLISVLATGKKKMKTAFEKGGLCCLETGALEHDRCARWLWLLTPAQMAQMA